MKTMTQLQAELRATAEHIENLSRELAQLQPSDQKKGLDFAHIQTIGKRYPIQDHCLVQMDADFQRQYLTLLTAPLLLEPREPENGWLFLQRILCGAGCTLHLADLQVDAASLTEQQLDTFSAAVLERGLADALMLDGMLLCLSSKGGEAVQDWLAALAELLGRTLPQVRELVELATFIAQEDKSGLRSFTRRKLTISLIKMGCHILPILGWYAQVKDGVLSCLGDGHTPLMNLEKMIPELFSMRQILTYVEFRKMVFTGKPVELDIGNFQLLLEDCVIRDIECREDKACFCAAFSNNSVVLRHCRFERLLSAGYTVCINGVRPLVLEDVHFQDIQNIGRDGIALWFDSCKMCAVTMDNIQSGGWWYSGLGGYATSDCYYKRCKGKKIDLPSGLEKKKEA